MPIITAGAAGLSAAGFGGGKGISTGAILSGLGALTGAAGFLQQANQNNAIAAQLRQDAERRQQLAQLDATEHARDTRRLLASQRARSGGSGSVAGTGTNLFLAEDTAAEAEFQRLKILSGGEADAVRLRNRATAEKSKASGNRLRAGATLLKGAGAAFGT